LLLQLELDFQQSFTQRGDGGVVGLFVDGVTDFSGFEHRDGSFQDSARLADWARVRHRNSRRGRIVLESSAARLAMDQAPPA
jgi:hypothetical protein